MNQKYFLLVSMTLITLPIFTSNRIEDSLNALLVQQENLSKTVEQLHNELKSLHANIREPAACAKSTSQLVRSRHCVVPSGSLIEPQNRSNSQNIHTDEKTERQEATNANKEFLIFSKTLVTNYIKKQQFFIQKQKELSALNSKIENIRYQILTGFSLKYTPIRILKPTSPLLLPNRSP